MKDTAYKIGEIYETVDYEIFKLNKFNRKVSVRPDLVKIAKTTGFAQPILVNEKMEVIDGQHRLMAAKHTGTPIQFTKVEGLNEDDITDINTTQKGWTMEDFLNFYAQKEEGYSDYVLLDSLWKDEKLTGHLNIQNLVGICIDTTTAGSSTTIVREGRFKFYNYRETERFLVFLRKVAIKLDLGRGETIKRSVANSIYKMYRLKKFDESFFLKRLSDPAVRADLKSIGDMHLITDKYLLEVYNKGLGEKKAIDYFVSRKERVEFLEEYKEWTKSYKEKG